MNRKPIVLQDMRSSIVLTLIVPFFIILLAVHTTAVPPLPAEFYGSVMTDGAPAPAGAVITAQIQGVDKGSINTTAPGFYGGPGLFDNRLKVNVTEEDYRPGEMTVVFMVNGQQALQNAVFEAGSSRQLDLTTGTGSVVSPVNVSAPNTGEKPAEVNNSASPNTSPDSSISSGSLSQANTINTNNESVPVQVMEPVSSNVSSDSSASTTSTITYGLDQSRIFASDDGLAEVSFAKDTMLFSPEGQFLTTVGLRSRSINDLPPLPANQSVQFSGYAYEIIPSGTYFNPNGTLTLKLPPQRAYDLINNGSVIYEYLPETASWEPISTTSNVFANTISAEIFEASIYGLYTPGSAAQNSQTSTSDIHSPPVFMDNQTTSLSPGVNTTIPADTLPVITPQAIITPQDIITPEPGQAELEPEVNESEEIVPDETITEEISAEPTEPVNNTKTVVKPGVNPLKIPGAALVSHLVSTVKEKFKGPVLIGTMILFLLILVNGAVYAVYRYWWMQRERNG